MCTNKAKAKGALNIGALPGYAIHHAAYFCQLYCSDLSIHGVAGNMNYSVEPNQATPTRVLCVSIFDGQGSSRAKRATFSNETQNQDREDPPSYSIVHTLSREDTYGM